MNHDIFDTIEFTKILAHLAKNTHSSLTQERILNTRPETDIHTIEKRLTEITEFRNILDFDDAFPFSSFENVLPLLKKVEVPGNYLEAPLFLKLWKLLKQSRRISNYLEARAEKYPLLLQQSRKLAVLPDLEKEIIRIIDDIQEKVRDNASPALSKIRRKMDGMQGRIRRRVEEIQRSWDTKGYLQEALITLRDDRYVLMVKENYRHRVQGVVHDQSGSGATLFIEPLETIELSNQLRQLELAERHEIEQILIGLTDQTRVYIEEIALTLVTLVKFDDIYVKASFSKRINGVQPQLNTEGRLHLMTARHPLLILKHERIDDVVPLNVKLGYKYQTLIISGPNAGGKTVAMKTVGLLAVMVQSGMHVPVFPDSEMPIFNEIYADIGDNQSIENDLSTFSSHIKRLKRITEHAGPGTLILIDEIGSGTDPEEGAGLAAAILKHLTRRRAMTIVSTHHGSLKAFAFETDGVENGSMEFNADSFEPTYHFRMGIPGSSYAFEIGQRLGIAPRIIESAREFVSDDKRNVEQLINKLDHKIQQQTELVRKADRKNSELSSVLKLYQDKVEKLEKHQRKLKKQAAEEAEKVLADANAALEKSIREIREKKASKDAIKSAKGRIATTKGNVAKVRKSLTESAKKTSRKKLKAEDVRPGQTAQWQKYTSPVTILDYPDSAKKVLIEAGFMKTRVSIHELVLLEGKAGRRQIRSAGRMNYNLPDQLSFELDLRGRRADDAILEVDKFIDQAIIAGMSELRIIHGKGTGALKTAIDEFLRRHPSVKKHREAEWNAGDSGVTVVTLK